MIREAGDTAHEKLLHLINRSFTSGKLPLAWKQAIIKPIPKPKEPNKFRPISLLSCLGKTAEKMVLTRLQWQVGKLHPNIYAYTNNKGTTDCLTNMLTSIKGRGYRNIHGSGKSL